MLKKLIKNKKPTEFLRMILIALLGVFLGFITYEIIYFINPFAPKETVSWFFAFLVGVARQHTLHRNFTFSHKTFYWKTLRRAYILNTGTLIFSATLNWFLTVVLNLHYRIAWVCCIVFTGLMGLLFLKRYVFNPKQTVHT